MEQAAASLQENEVLFIADHQQKEGQVYHLRGNVEIRTPEVRLRADEVDYAEALAKAEARGHVYYRNLTSGEELWADHGEYDLNSETGTFYEVRGRARADTQRRPRILYTELPFQFAGEWAEKKKDEYILHDGYITNCDQPKLWWKLSGPKFRIVPGKFAIAQRSIFKLKGIPIFYSPYFYKSLKREPRRSGFLTPNIGNSSRLGRMVGVGYYWAPSRSYDLTYRTMYFSQRGFAHLADFRGKPTQTSDFNVNLYAVNDRGLQLNQGQVRDESGWFLTFTGKTELKGGWTARAEVNVLSSFLFRQAFTQTYTEAVASQVSSVAYLTRHWTNFTVNGVFTRQENYQSIREGDRVLIRKLPQVEFTSRDLQVTRKLPVWVSLDSSAALMRRKQPLFETRQFSQRADFAPRIFTAFEVKGFHFIPSFGAEATHYGQSRVGTDVSGQNLTRASREFSLELVTPSFAKVFNRPSMLGEKLKHVIEPRAIFRTVKGIDNFDNVIRFDTTDLLSNTTELEVSLTNRLYAKHKDGKTQEILSWQLWQKRYFDPTFGGALTPGTRNVLQTSIDLTAFAFLDGQRTYSPLVSALRLQPLAWLGASWRTDYDSRRGRLVNSEIMADVRLREKYLISLGHNAVRSVPVQILGENEFLGLSPNANQFRGLFLIGDPNRRGWNAAFSSIYDYRQGILQFATTQVTYNTDCCGFSVQYRRFSFGTRNENQIRFAFAVANIGSFGNLRKQERLF